MRTRIAAVAAVISERNRINLAYWNDTGVMAEEACGIDAAASQEPIVPKTTIDHVVAIPSIEDVVLLVPDDGVGSGSSGDVFYADQRVGRYLRKKIVWKVQPELDTGAAGSVEAEMHVHTIGGIRSSADRIEEVIAGIVDRINSAFAVEDVASETARQHVIQRVARQGVVKSRSDKALDSDQFVACSVAARRNAALGVTEHAAQPDGHGSRGRFVTGKIETKVTS